MKVVCVNRKAYYDYLIEETFEAGIALLGTEVKSLREGRANLTDSYVLLKDNGAVLLNCNISPYSHGTDANHEPTRTRKLLLHDYELRKLAGKMSRKGFSLIPLKIYFKGPLAKVEVGVARGKKLFEKREAIKEKEAKKEIERSIKSTR